MTILASQASALRVASIGLISFAAAMGIGRFAFTPLLPLMQERYGISLSQGGLLASANYAGYLIGALVCFALSPRPGLSTRVGLVVVAASTLAMATTQSLLAWIALRAIAGAATAFVAVGVSVWALASLGIQRRSTWSGWVFAGVGAGICLAGLIGLAVGSTGGEPSFAWLALGIAATAVVVIAWQSLPDPVNIRPSKAASMRSALDWQSWRLIGCYGAFGFGYIIPATFLPAAARLLVNDPAVFGWTWPVFGLAAAASTVAAASLLRNVAPRRMWAAGQAVMAFGVLVPIVHMSLATLLVSAFCVGGTFMVITMAAMQEARLYAGASSPRLIAAITAAFATGQLLGPLAIGNAASAADAMRTPSLIASALLLSTALTLLARPVRIRGAA